MCEYSQPIFSPYHTHGKPKTHLLKFGEDILVVTSCEEGKPQIERHQLIQFPILSNYLHLCIKSNIYPPKRNSHLPTIHFQVLC